MPKSDEELQKHTLNLFSGDYARLQEFYPEIGAAVIIRKIVRSFIEQVNKEGVKIEAGVEINI